MTTIGRVRELVRYPVKSMAGTPTESAVLGWHGLDGDRRFAFRRVGDASGFPWLSASHLPELILFRPLGLDASSGEPLSTHVRTPSGAELALGGPELNAEVSGRFGSGVELMKLKHGIFDEGEVSVIAPATIAAIGRAAGLDQMDPRRFRANVLLETESDEPFLEDAWVGRTLVFGEDEGGPAVGVTLRDERCAMVNLDPETAARDARVMKAVVRLNGNHAGAYAKVVRCGPIRVGDRVSIA
jgi:uncharacterized protein YcbX